MHVGSPPELAVLPNFAGRGQPQEAARRHPGTKPLGSQARPDPAAGAPEREGSRDLGKRPAAVHSPLGGPSARGPSQAGGREVGTGRRAGWAGAGALSTSRAASRASFQVRAVRRSMRMSG